jgi:MFS family permease
MRRLWSVKQIPQISTVATVITLAASMGYVLGPIAGALLTIISAQKVFLIYVLTSIITLICVAVIYGKHLLTRLNHQPQE